MQWKSELKPLLWMVGSFFVLFFLPLGWGRFDNAVIEGLYLAKWYAREHVILCFIPALFIAGAIAVFVSKDAMMNYLGPRAHKAVAYGVASVSGAVLAVCSCTILPLFAGIYRMGAGIGPASAFLYAGPAINVLAVILTARVLGMELGIARAVGAVVFSVIIGLIMELVFKTNEQPAVRIQGEGAAFHISGRQIIVFFAVLVGILVFSNWSQPANVSSFWYAVFTMKWYITAGLWIIFVILLVLWFDISIKKGVLAGIVPLIMAIIVPDYPIIVFSAGIVVFSWVLTHSSVESDEWFSGTWDLTKQIVPLLFAGVIVSGILLGRPGQEGIIPSQWVAESVGGNSLMANFSASIIGAFMYFATLTEIPILQGLLGSGMGKGPALALLLAGPAVSLPSMLVIRSVIGTKKTAVYLFLVVIMAALSGYLFGMLVQE